MVHKEPCVPWVRDCNSGGGGGGGAFTGIGSQTVRISSIRTIFSEH